MNSLSKLVMKQPANLSQIFNQFNNTTDDYTNKDPDNAVKCKYDIEEIQTENSKQKQVFTYVSH